MKLAHFMGHHVLIELGRTSHRLAGVTNESPAALSNLEYSIGESSATRERLAAACSNMCKAARNCLAAFSVFIGANRLTHGL